MPPIRATWSVPSSKVRASRRSGRVRSPTSTAFRNDCRVKITLLGTGSPIPDANRAGPATLVQSAGATILVDCGRGVLMRLVAAGVLPPMLNAVFVTHLHSDHLTDLNDVITTHWVI